MQRSNDAVNFTGLYNEYATALRCRQPFEFIDDKPDAGVNYYRVKIYDADGKIYYSNIVVLKHEENSTPVMSIMPNPVVNGKLNIKTDAAEKTQTDFIITDLQGRILLKKTVNLSAGINTVLIDVTSLPNGAYLLTGISACMGKQLLSFVIQ